jgi:phosphoribosyl 1,2-cyclic phosphodiesterase
MQIRFWGTRGSIAKPGPATVRYGGNTSCVEIRSDSGTLIVVDCGTGAHGLGQHLIAQQGGAVDGHMLISHTHWDHIQGIPFFAPFLSPGNVWDIYGPKGTSHSLHAALAGQMEHPYFPVTLDEFGATIRYHDLVEGAFRIDDTRVVARYLNHPGLTLGYRLEVDGASVVYCSDHEPHSATLASGESPITGIDLQHVAFVADADLVIHDAQYTALEYAAKIGWGHSPAEYAVRVCRDAGVKRVALTHHDPLRDDDALDRIVDAMRLRLRNDGSPLEIVAAAEGLRIHLPALRQMRATSNAYSP